MTFQINGINVDNLNTIIYNLTNINKYVTFDILGNVNIVEGSIKLFDSYEELNNYYSREIENGRLSYLDSDKSDDDVDLEL